MWCIVVHLTAHLNPGRGNEVGDAHAYMTHSDSCPAHLSFADGIAVLLHSALDAESEYLVKEALDRLMVGDDNNEN